MSAPAVEFQGVAKRYGDLWALKGIDLAIPQGSFYGLLGHNGAGKSTLINAMAGLVTPTRGRIRVMGHDVQRNYRASRRALGVVPQELIDEPFFSVRELLELQSGYFGLHGRRQRAWLDELLERLSLTDKANVKTHQLSGGMKRRLLIALALVHHPEVLVLDEPTAGVDVALRRSLWTFARELHAGGMTIILTTHYLEEAESLCDRIAIIHRGELVVEADKAELLARSPWKHVEIIGRGEPSGALAGQVCERLADGWRFRLPREAGLGALLDQARACGIEIEDLRVIEPDLEQVFLSLTEEGA
ncbi:ABC transporter ATP-binding protein [Sulfurivirga sp.]|uniref:ABC transporter ATP-binding protein n=1 Tax=Sulfurivirga sp. TaxID=2614236 RepID=UPI0025D40D73|nr:ABC transporter ATP-binding protein [Sulfurivirga sp.]